MNEGINESNVTVWLADHVPALIPPVSYSLIAGGNFNLTFRCEDADGNVFVERFGAALSGANIEILDRLTLSAPGYWRYSLECKNQVAAHWDFRGDNMLFGQRNGELAMVTIDWTGLLSGGGRDLGHFLGTSLVPEFRKTHELELLQHYRETLLAQGVSNFSLQECMDDFRRNLFYPVHVVVNVTESVNVDARAKQLFASMFNRACEAIKDLDALELIESL